MSYPNSFSGHSLRGEAVTRFVYLDESGTSKGEPDLVVAGLIVEPDKHLNRLEEGLDEIRVTHIPEEIRDGFIFHAQELLNGKKVLTREMGWTFERGMAAAHGLVDLLIKNNVAVVWRRMENAIEVPAYKKVPPGGVRHAIAFVATLMHVDHFMLSEAPGEICIVVAEDHPEHRKAIKDAQAAYRNPDLLTSAELNHPKFPIRTVKDTVHFVKKDESPVMQLADLCCYVIKQALRGNERYDEIGLKLNDLVIAHDQT